jgi:hypothetical protein
MSGPPGTGHANLSHQQVTTTTGNPMKLFNLGVALIFTTFMATDGALAQTGSECVFTIHNDTEQNTLMGFYTSDDDGETWSSNWLSDRLEPGQTASAEFSADTCACDQSFQAGWLDVNGGEALDDEHTIDICEASNVYLGDNEVSFD